MAGMFYWSGTSDAIFSYLLGVKLCTEKASRGQAERQVELIEGYGIQFNR